jgi:hypothetical protein
MIFAAHDPPGRDLARRHRERSEAIQGPTRQSFHALAKPLVKSRFQQLPAFGGRGAVKPAGWAATKPWIAYTRNDG